MEDRVSNRHSRTPRLCPLDFAHPIFRTHQRCRDRLDADLRKHVRFPRRILAAFAVASLRRLHRPRRRRAAVSRINFWRIPSRHAHRAGHPAKRPTLRLVSHELDPGWLRLLLWRHLLLSLLHDGFHRRADRHAHFEQRHGPAAHIANRGHREHLLRHPRPLLSFVV